jgi:hypothetical protein
MPCLVAPETADAAIVAPKIAREKQWLNEHYVWLDPKVERREKLLVFLPGQTNANLNSPAQFKYVGREAARLGYHVIVLMYPNTVGVGGLAASVCKWTRYDDAAQLCQENVRLEVLDGKARGGTPAAPLHLVFPGMDDVHAEAHSVYHRLTKVLEHLALTHPREGWSRFLVRHAPDGAAPSERIAWKKIVMSGFSYGGSEAELIAQSHRVHRVAMLASPNDGTGPSGSSANVPAAFVHIGETPPNRHYALGHAHDPMHAQMLATWEKFRMFQFGGEVFEDAITSSPPYGGTHMLSTNRPPSADQKTGMTTWANAHGSVAHDWFTPLDDPYAIWPAGTPLLRDAWRHILGTDGRDGDDDSGDHSSDDSGHDDD